MSIYQFPYSFPSSQSPTERVRVNWQNPLTRDLNGYYPLNIFNGAANVGGSNDYEVYGGVEPGVIDGKPCYVFDGVDDSHISYGVHQHAYETGSFTVSAWCWLDSTAADGVEYNIAGTYQAGGASDGRWLCYYTKLSGTDSLTNYYDNPTTITSTKSVSDEALHHDVWAHLVYVFDRITPQWGVFVNGVRRGGWTAVGNNTPLPNFYDFKIGGGSPLGQGLNRDQSESCWQGGLRDIAVWHRALSETEIASLYKDPYQMVRPAFPMTGAVFAASGGTDNTIDVPLGPVW